MVLLYTIGEKWQPFFVVAVGQSIVFTPTARLTRCQFEQAKGIPVMYLHPLRFGPLGVGPGGSLRQCILLGPGYNVIAFRIRVLGHDPNY